MRSHVSKMRNFPLLAVLAAGLIACTAGGDTGRLSLSLTDKPSDEYNAVYVTIQEIAIHAAGDPEGSWTKVLDVNKTFDLLTLANGVREQLGIVSLDPGHYTQMRLLIGTVNSEDPAQFANYVIDTDNVIHEMKIPSGLQTGIKLVQGFDINEDSTTELTFDFDASRSVVRAGNGQKYLLKPTIHVVDTAEATVISGEVTTTSGEDVVGVGGALVNVQIYDPALTDPKDQIAVRTSTFTDDTDAARGAYKFFFAVEAPTTINLVATKEGFTPAALRFPIENGTAYTGKDFALVAPAGTGTVDIVIAGAPAGQPVTLSLRQTVTLEAAEVMIEVLSLSVVDVNPEDFSWPAGEYTLVAWTEGMATPAPVAVSVVAGQPVTANVTFN